MQRDSQQNPAGAVPAAPAAARPGTEAAAAAAVSPTWLQRGSAAARMQHLGDGVVWMQSTSCVCVTPIPPPKLSDRGLRGQSSLSLQRLTEAGLQPAVLHPVGQHPPLLLCHPFPPPPAHTSCCWDTEQRARMVHACMARVQLCKGGDARICVCKLCKHACAHPHTQPNSAACSCADISWLQGEGHCTHVCKHTQSDPPTHPSPAPQTPLCAKMGPKMHLQG